MIAAENVPSAAAAFVLVTTLLQNPTTAAQIGNDVVVYGSSQATGADVVVRFDHRLNVLGEITMPPTTALEKQSDISTDGTGTRWITWGALGSKELACLGPGGLLLPPITLEHNPVNVSVTSSGDLCALTRIPLNTPGPLYRVQPGGRVQWSNPSGPMLYSAAGYPQALAVTADEIWIGGTAPPTGGFWWRALIVRVEDGTGDVAQTQWLSPTGGHANTDELLAHLIAAPNGTLWAMHGLSTDLPWTMSNTDGETVIQSFQVMGGKGGPQADLRLDGQGRLYLRRNWDLSAQPPEFGDQLYQCDPSTPESIDKTYQLGGFIQGWAFGGTHEEAFAVVTPQGPIAIERLERINLVTGVKSSRPLDPTWLDNTMGFGDPTGFIYANIVDRQGDNDGDGAPNGAETAAGSNPFDATSRPSGPKVYVSFAQSNGALILKYVDPDGILNPTGGLNLGSLSVVSSQHGQIFQFLLSFLTFVQVSPDGTTVTALFGALPIAPDLKWQFEATVADKTGATGWDWQVTRPGDL